MSSSPPARNAGRLRFSDDPQALAGARQVWITFDTPVDEEDRADVDWVLETSPCNCSARWRTGRS